MARKIWFGNETAGFRWATCPRAGLTVSNAGYSEGIALESGSRARVRSARTSKVYNIEFLDKSKDIDGIQVYNKAATGYWGPNLNWHFADPYAFETNLFSAGWATPGLAESGWRRIGTNVPTFSNVATNSYNQPRRKATYSITTAANATPLSNTSIPYFIIPIPPTHTLRLGASGAATGTGVVKVESWVNGAGAPGASANLTLLSETGATRLNATVSGATYNYAKVYLTRTSSAASTLTLTSMMAQLWPTGFTPALSGNHQPGEGHTKLQFADDAIVEDYVYMYPPRKGISTTLEEVI